MYYLRPPEQVSVGYYCGLELLTITIVACGWHLFSILRSTSCDNFDGYFIFRTTHIVINQPKIQHEIWNSLLWLCRQIVHKSGVKKLSLSLSKKIVLFVSISKFSIQNWILKYKAFFDISQKPKNRPYD